MNQTAAMMSVEAAASPAVPEFLGPLARGVKAEGVEAGEPARTPHGVKFSPSRSRRADHSRGGEQRIASDTIKLYLGFGRFPLI